MKKMSATSFAAIISLIMYCNLLEESAEPERQVSPEKLYRAALLRGRFADIILKAQEKSIEKVSQTLAGVACVKLDFLVPFIQAYYYFA